MEAGTATPSSPGIGLEEPAAGVSKSDRTYVMWMHLGGMLTSLVLNVGMSFPLPLALVLVLWLVKRDQSPFIDDHGKEALNFQISHLIYAVGILVLGAALCVAGWIVWVPGGVFLFVLTLVAGIMASRAAHEGRYYRYPMCLRFVK